MIVPQGRIVQLPGIGDRRVKGSGGGLRKMQGRRTLMMGRHIIWIVGHHQFGMVGILSSSRRSRGPTSSKGLDSTAQTKCHQYHHHQDENPPNHYHHPHHDHFFPMDHQTVGRSVDCNTSLFRCLCLSRSFSLLLDGCVAPNVPYLRHVTQTSWIVVLVVVVVVVAGEILASLELLHLS